MLLLCWQEEAELRPSFKTLVKQLPLVQESFDESRL